MQQKTWTQQQNWAPWQQQGTHWINVLGNWLDITYKTLFDCMKTYYATTIRQFERFLNLSGFALATAWGLLERLSLLELDDNILVDVASDIS